MKKKKYLYIMSVIIATAMITGCGNKIDALVNGQIFGDESDISGNIDENFGLELSNEGLNIYFDENGNIVEDSNDMVSKEGSSDSEKTDIISKDSENTENTQNANTQKADNKEAADNIDNSKDNNKDNSSSKQDNNSGQISLQDIAVLNNMAKEDLNILKDEEGNITFIGNCYCDLSIKDKRTALQSVNRISNLLGLNNVNVRFEKEATSANSECTYYYFSINYKEADTEQLEKTDGTLIVIADKEGNSLGISIKHSEKSPNESADSAISAPDEFFENKEDAGLFEYKISLRWVYDSYPEFEDDLIKTVSVPVIKDTETGLYYLGDLNNKILVCNYYDLYDEEQIINPVVTEDPSDIDSWHFMYEENGDTRYFINQDYIISTYQAYFSLNSDLNNTYNIQELNSPSVLLGVYYCESDYPLSIMDFPKVLYGPSYINGWQLTGNSPMYAECLSAAALADVYFKGMLNMNNSSNISSSLEEYSVTEGFSNILAIMYADNTGEEAYGWSLTGHYSDKIQILSDPYSSGNPLYVDGLYYRTEIFDAFSLSENMSNSSVLISAAYDMINDDREKLEEGEELLTSKDSMKLWYEILYAGSHCTTFEEINAYLQFAAKCNNYSEGNISRIERIMKCHGLDGECEEYKESLKSENVENIPFVINTEDENLFSENNIYIGVYDTDGNITGSLIMDEAEKNLKVRENDKFLIKLLINDNKESYSFNLTTQKGSKKAEKYTLNIKDIIVAADQAFVVPEGETIKELSDNCDIFEKQLLLDGQVNIKTSGTYYIVTTTDKDKKYGSFNIYRIKVK